MGDPHPGAERPTRGEALPARLVGTGRSGGIDRSAALARVPSAGGKVLDGSGITSSRLQVGMRRDGCDRGDGTGPGLLRGVVRMPGPTGVEARPEEPVTPAEAQLRATGLWGSRPHSSHEAS